MADLGNQKIKDTYQLVLQADASGNLQKLDGTSPSLIINSAFTYNVGTLVDGYVLKSNGSGVASWGALNADIYLSAATLNGTTLELDTTSGNTLSVDLSSLEGDSYWSANTNGSISPSGTSTNIRISGDTIIKGDLSLTSNNASLTLPYYGTLKAKNSAGTTRTVLYNIGDTGVVFGDTNTVTTKLQGTNVELEGEVTVKDDINISGDTFIKGDLGVTGLTNSNELSAQTLTAKTNVNIGSEVSYLSIHNQYIKWKTSNRIFISSSPTSSAPNRLYDDWRLNDSDYLYFGTGNDLSIYHNGTNSIIDNNTGTLQILASAITIGDTTSEVTINDNLVVDEDLTVNGTTLYVDSSNTKVGVGTTSPTHELTVSGGGAWIAWTEPTQIDFVNGSSFFGYTPSDATVPTPLTIGGTTVRVLVQGAYYYGTTTSPFFVNGRGYWGVTWAGSNATLTGEDAENCIAYGGVIPGNDKYFSVAAGDVIFQVSGASVMSGTTDLVDIFASSAITNQDVYWTATTDGTGISPSGSNVTTVVRMSGDTHIQGNLGVSGNTYTSGGVVVGNMSLANNQLDISSGDFTLDVEGDITLDANGADIILSDDGTDFGRFKRDSSDFIIKSEGNNNDIVFRGQDAGVTRDALLLDMSDAGTATFNNGVNISGATSGRTDASFGGNLGISGKTFLDDHLRFSSAKQVQWVDSSTYVQGTTTQLILNGDLNITQSATNQIKMTSTEMTNVGRVGISGDTNINGVLSGLTDARFGGNLGVTGNTYFNGNISYPNARFFIQTTGAIKLLANNNWAGFNRTTGGLDSSGFWNVDTGSGTIGTAYNYYGSYRNTFFTVPYACKLTRMVIQGANTTNSEVGQDWNIHLAKSPVVDDSDSISWAAVTGVTKTLPDNRDKRFIYDISIDQNCSQFDTFFLAFQGTNSADTWLSMNVILEFEYTLT